MKTINLVNITLATIVLALLLLNLPDDEIPYQPLTGLQAEDISIIRIETGQRALEFTRQQTWQLEALPGKALKQDIIDKLLGITRTHSYRQFDNTTGNLKAFGLDQSVDKIMLNNTEFKFGTTEPAQQLRYVLVNDQVHLITDLYLQFLLADENFFIASAD